MTNSNRSIRNGLALALFALGLYALSGGFSSPTVDSSGEAFRDVFQSSIAYDFDAFETPKHAMRRADAVVSGSIVNAEQGLEVLVPNPDPDCRDDDLSGEVVGCIEEEMVMFSTFLSVEVDVSKARKFRGKRPENLTVQIEIAPHAREEALAALPIGADVVMFLEDASDWKPTPGSQSRWAKNAPDDATLWIPFVDGFFIEGSAGQAISVFTHGNETGEYWGFKDGFVLEDLEKSLTE